jgi:hypothetical protein
MTNSALCMYSPYKRNAVLTQSALRHTVLWGLVVSSVMVLAAGTVNGPRLVLLAVMLSCLGSCWICACLLCMAVRCRVIVGPVQPVVILIGVCFVSCSEGLVGDLWCMVGTRCCLTEGGRRDVRLGVGCRRRCYATKCTLLEICVESDI